MTNASPSINPANNDTLVGVFRQVLNKTLQRMDCALPARVISYDRTLNRATVKPQVAMLTTNGEAISKAQIPSVPVLQSGGGGFVLSFNLLPGDLGWLIACDRDISLFLSGYNEQKPNTERIHNFSDAFFIPDPMTGYTIAGEDAQNAVLQSLSGDVKISLSNDSINIQTTVSVNIESPVINLIGDVVIDGDLDITGEINAQGDISTDSDISADGKCTVLGNIASGADITAAGSITPGTPIPP